MGGANNLNNKKPFTNDRSTKKTLINPLELYDMELRNERLAQSDTQYLNENPRGVKEYHLSLPDQKNKANKMANQNKFVYDNDQGNQSETLSKNKPKNGIKIFCKI